MRVRDFFKKMSDRYDTDAKILELNPEFELQLDDECEIIKEEGDETIAEIESGGFIVNNNNGSYYSEKL